MSGESQTTLSVNLRILHDDLFDFLREHLSLLHRQGDHMLIDRLNDIYLNVLRNQLQNQLNNQLLDNLYYDLYEH